MRWTANLTSCHRSYKLVFHSFRTNSLGFIFKTYKPKGEFLTKQFGDLCFNISFKFDYSLMTSFYSVSSSGKVSLPYVKVTTFVSVQDSLS